MTRESRLFAELRRTGALALLLLLLATVAACLPLYALFAHRAPPLWSTSAWIAFAWAGLALVEGVLRLDRAPPPARRAAAVTLLGVAIMALYHIGLDRWTVVPPSPWPPERIQAGFDTRDWSLTPEARSFLEGEDANMRTPEELMLAFGAFDKGETYLVWASWTIFAAGLLLIVFHVLGVRLLVAGLLGLARARRRAFGPSHGSLAWERGGSAESVLLPVPQAEGGGAGPRRLVVIVPAIRGRVSSWEPLLARLKAAPQLRHASWVRWDHGQGVRSSVSARKIALSLCARVDAEWAKAGGYDDVVLIGHSLGGLIVRQAFLFARGNDARACQLKAWGERISRIALFAAINRGLSPQSALQFRLASWLISVAPWLDRYLAFQVLQGSDFVTNLRIEWIRHFASLGQKAPAVVQLLGVHDDLVKVDDSLDVEQFPNSWQILVPDAGHGDLHHLQDVPDPMGRYALIRQALLGEVPAVAGEARIRGSETYVMVLHGIRASNETWVQDVVTLLRGRLPDHSGIKCSTYGFLSALRFAIPPTRRASLQWFQDLYSTCLAENPGAVFHFIGHSNGTYLLGESLRRIHGMRFKRVVLAGSVLPDDYDWNDRLARAQVETVRNHRSSSDVPVGILCSVLRGLGMGDVGTGGVFGFKTAPNPRADEIYWYEGGHSRPVQADNLPALVEFAVSGKDLDLKLIDRKRDNSSFARLSRAAGILGPALVLTWVAAPILVLVLSGWALLPLAVWGGCTLLTVVALEII